MLKKLRDVTPEEFKQWKNEVCKNGHFICRDCVFKGIECSGNDYSLWVNNKELYSSIALDREIEIVEKKKNNILPNEAKAYLAFVIKPFKGRLDFITRVNKSYSVYLEFDLGYDEFGIPLYEKDYLFGRMKENKKYTLKELGL